jgi:hypothetical protein
MPVIEIEADEKHNRSMFFLPLQRPIRGRLDFGREADPEAIRLTRDFPTPIPGQRIFFDPDREEAAVVEPLHGDEHKALRELIASKNLGALDPERVTVPAPKDTHRTFYYWLRRAIDAGLARVVRGTIPDMEEIQKRMKGRIQKSWIVPDRGPDRKDRIIEKLVALVGASLTPAGRKALEAALEEE